MFRSFIQLKLSRAIKQYYHTLWANSAIHDLCLKPDMLPDKQRAGYNMIVAQPASRNIMHFSLHVVSSPPLYSDLC